MQRAVNGRAADRAASEALPSIPPSLGYTVGSGRLSAGSSAGVEVFQGRANGGDDVLGTWVSRFRQLVPGETGRMNFWTRILLIAAGGLTARVLAVWAYRGLLRWCRKDPNEIERLWRLDVNRRGRITSAKIVISSSRNRLQRARGARM